MDTTDRCRSKRINTGLITIYQTAYSHPGFDTFNTSSGAAGVKKIIPDILKSTTLTACSGGSVTAAIRFCSTDHSINYRSRTPDTGLDRNRAEVTVLFTCTALHTSVFIRYRNFFILKFKHRMGTDFHASSTPCTLIRKNLQCCNIFKICHNIPQSEIL